MYFIALRSSTHFYKLYLSRRSRRPLYARDQRALVDAPSAKRVNGIEWPIYATLQVARAAPLIGRVNTLGIEANVLLKLVRAYY